MHIDMSVDTDALRRNVAALSAMTRRAARESVREASVMVVQTGGKSGKEAIIPQAAKANREIVRAVRRYRHGIEELAIDARPEAPGDKALYLIARPKGRRPIGKSGGRKWWTFEREDEARAHRRITFRGVARAGFWAQLPALGRPIPAGRASVAYLADVPGLTETAVRLDSDVPAVTVTNKSTAIGLEKAPHWQKAILMRVNNRIAGMAKSNADRLAAFRRAGGVAWSEPDQAYTEI